VLFAQSIITTTKSLPFPPSFSSLSQLNTIQLQFTHSLQFSLQLINNCSQRLFSTVPAKQSIIATSIIITKVSFLCVHHHNQETTSRSCRRAESLLHHDRRSVQPRIPAHCHGRDSSLVPVLPATCPAPLPLAVDTAIKSCRGL
jgi:hypothetical protein